LSRRRHEADLRGPAEVHESGETEIALVVLENKKGKMASARREPESILLRPIDRRSSSKLGHP